MRTSAVEEGTSLDRLRQRLVFGRFLARVAEEFGEKVLVKGGVALEHRISSARATRDVDLRIFASASDAASGLSRAATLDLGDELKFRIAGDEIATTGHAADLPEDVSKFRAECQVAGRRYGWPFRVDVSHNDVVCGAPDMVTAPDFLGFMGVLPPTLRLYPAETHIAEKVHALTLPRDTPNSPWFDAS